MKKIVIYIFLVWLPAVNVLSQEQEKNEISIMGGGGVSILLHQFHNGIYKFGFNGTTGIGYGFFFNDAIGITTGAEFNYYRFRHTVFDNSFEGHPFRTINIPVMCQFQYPLFFEDHFCYFALGGKMGIPLKNNDYQLNDITFKRTVFFLASVEVGMKWNTSSKFSLYTGLYGDYGINNMAEDFTNKLNPAAFGLKLRLAFRIPDPCLR